MLDLFTALAAEITPGTADATARTPMLLHEGAPVAHGPGVFPDAVAEARDQAFLLAWIVSGAGGTVPTRPSGQPRSCFLLTVVP
ncbi:hypothetical protein ACFZDI_00845 [Streptomyces sp. NPDC007907]|uniref:hypothetical protein n=1 Tax=Streptomyces sp. NPDC007907 TaxID=3364789 RepID=UPI0036E9BC17